MLETQETRIQSLSWEDPLEKEMATYSSIPVFNPLDRGAWWATVHEVTESDTTEWLSMYAEQNGSHKQNERTQPLFQICKDPLMSLNKKVSWPDCIYLIKSLVTQYRTDWGNHEIVGKLYMGME